MSHGCFKAATLAAERFKRLDKPATSPVERVVIGRCRDVNTRDRQAGDVRRVHPVVNVLVQAPIAARRDARLKIDDPCDWCTFIDDGKGISPQIRRGDRHGYRPMSCHSQVYVPPGITNSIPRRYACEGDETSSEAMTGHVLGHAELVGVYRKAAWQPSPGHSPMSSAQSPGFLSMNSRMRARHCGSCRTSSWTPWDASHFSSPMNDVFSPITTFGIL